MSVTWIVVADSSRARLLAHSPQRGLEELEVLAHPEGRLHETQLTSDLPGRAFDHIGQGRHAMEDKTSPKRQEAIDFAKRVATRLEAGRTAHDFERIVLVAEPRFLGMLRDEVSSEVAKLVSYELDKNLSQSTLEEIRSHISTHV